MIIYVIGALFTMGYLERVDEEHGMYKFKGFKGLVVLICLCLFWPFTVGSLVSMLICDKDEKKGELSYEQ